MKTSLGLTLLVGLSCGAALITRPASANDNLGRQVLTSASVILATPATAATTEQLELFEKKIRPILIQHCYECHNSLDTQEGGLALDYQDALLAGGDSGEVIVPGNPQESILIWALRHENGYEMPANAPPLDESVIRDFERWVKLGAPDPRHTKPTAEQLDQTLPWEQVRAQRKEWWSFQPLRNNPLPDVADKHWNQSAIDRFVFDRLQQAELVPQPEASPEVLVRRVHLILTGLPPTPEVTQAFIDNPSGEAYERVVDTLLDSPAFGQRWARHWMDWYRYAESHGSEGDPPIPYAQAYRDYLIRALNADVPYDQLLREHLAGDLLSNPRINEELNINESAIGPAHLRMVPHGFGVTDAYGEQITFIDNQIDVISKAMLGLTVSCARCHDHKFDPVSQKDFYRFYGVMVGSRPSTVLVDAPQKLATNKRAMIALKWEIRRALTNYWLSEVAGLPAWLADYDKPSDQPRSHSQPLGTWLLLKDAAPHEYQRRVKDLLADVQRLQATNREAISAAEFYVDLREPANAHKWYSSGNGTASTVSPAGSFSLWGSGDRAIRTIYPRGIYTHLLSDKHAAVFSSKNYGARGEGTYVRVAGSGAQLRAPVRNYPLVQGLHPAKEINHEDLSWVSTQEKWKYWQGEKVHYELSTNKDKLPKAGDKDRSWFGIAEIIAGDRPLEPEGAPLVSLVDDPATITSRHALADAYTITLGRIIRTWRDGELDDSEAEFLHAFVQRGFLTNRMDQLPEPLRQKIEQYRELESAVPVPTRAPGVLDAEPVDQPLLVRGDHRQEAEPVARRFLEAFGDDSSTRKSYGRLELAEDMVSEANTLKTRVLMNRLWAYVFGRGLVASTDNFGRLGNQPTHPALLDYLSLDFQRNGWSIKRALRQMVLSRTFRSSSQAPPQTRERDAQNIYLSYFKPRRLDAEAIYDCIGFLAGTEERAVYLPVVRNRLNRFLSTFNVPVPTSTVSSRTNTNVPAQSLAMMNGKIVDEAARRWSHRIERDEQLPSVKDKIVAMFWQAYARSPSDFEIQRLLSYMTSQPNGARQIQELTAKKRRGQRQLRSLKEARAHLLDPVRKRLQQEVARRHAAFERNAPKPIDLRPIASWDFDGDPRDAIGHMHGELIGDARIEQGALILDGGCVLTAPLATPLQEKTLEVLVQLDRLDQRGGGAMSIQTLDGHEFDSIVYAEIRPATWLAGSNHFERTIPLAGEPEQQAVDRPVRMVVAYDADGTIRAYRDGKLYAEPYRKSELHSFDKGDAQVAFGLRHGTAPAGERLLTGRIHEARLYDRALTGEEIAAAASRTHKETVTRDMLLAALNAEQTRRLSEQEGRIDRLEEAIGDLSRQLNELQERRRRNGPFFGIAHALLNSKELIYVY